MVSDCNNCGHCVELKGEKEEDPLLLRGLYNL